MALGLNFTNGLSWRNSTPEFLTMKLRIFSGNRLGIAIYNSSNTRNKITTENSDI
jgi:hypothetical protein